MRATAIGHVLFALYPLLIFAGLHFFSPRSVGAFVLIALALRYRRDAARLLGGFSAGQLIALSLPALLGAAVLIMNSESLLRLYPSAISASMLTASRATLYCAPTMVEHLHRLQDLELSPT